jgi:hypothetical protein
MVNWDVPSPIDLRSMTDAHEWTESAMGKRPWRTQFFDTISWWHGLPPADVVVTVQAVHELRHKRRVPALHATIRRLLRPGDVFLMCDHFVGAGGMTNREL